MHHLVYFSALPFASSPLSQSAECSRLNERLAVLQQQLADVQTARDVDTIDLESRQARAFFLRLLASIHAASFR